MAAPLQETLERVRPALVIAAIVPAVLLGGTAQPTSRLPRDEDTSRPARPMLLQQQAVPVPGAIVIQTYAPRDEVVVQPDHTWPIAPIVGQQPTPIASAWRPTPPPGANTDPLRPLLIIADPPDSTLVQPSMLAIGRLSRPEDPQWPARPAAIATGQQPIPWSQTLATYAPRDTAVAPEVRLSPPLVIQDTPDPTLQQSAAAWIGRLPRDEDTTRPARPAIVSVGAQPTPAAQALAIGIVHDAPVIPPDRLAFTTIISGATPLPSAPLAIVGAVKAAPTDRLAPTAIRTGAQPLPLAQALATYAPRDQIAAPPDRLAPTQLISGRQPTPDAASITIGALRRAPAERLAPTAVLVAQPPIPGAIGMAVGAVHATPTARVPQITPLVIGEPRVPLLDRLAWWGTRPRDATQAAPVFRAATLRSPSGTGSARGPSASGDITSPNNDGTIEG